jgi:hypothetical protein
MRNIFDIQYISMIEEIFVFIFKFSSLQLFYIILCYLYLLLYLKFLVFLLFSKV